MIRNILLLGLAGVAGCLADPAPLTSDVGQPLQIEACDGATTGASAAFTLQNVSRDGRDLRVDVQTGGGCGAHHFAVCWNGIVQPSAPPMLGLELSQESDDLCEALLSLELRIDTSALRARGLIPRLPVHSRRRQPDRRRQHRHAGRVATGARDAPEFAARRGRQLLLRSIWCAA